MHCRICDAQCLEILDLGKMPIANGFLHQNQFGSEYFFHLQVARCPSCSMVQLVEQPSREQMFHENYAFLSSTSRRMAEHFTRFAQWVRDNHLSHEDPLVVEIGSNDGIMLRRFAAAGIRHVGVEPSANVAQMARGVGVETICQFFDEQCAQQIGSTHGPADVVLAANVMCHIPYLHSVAAGVASLLKPKGLLIFEDPYLGDILEKTSYDQVYDEHVFYFSVTSVQRLFNRHGMEVIDVVPQPVHGGSMRYVIARQGAHEVSPAVRQAFQNEQARGFARPEVYLDFQQKVQASRENLRGLLLQLKAQGRRVVGYGATSKSTTVINYCGITPDLVEFISDTTPTKQGKFTPGQHIPVKPYAEFAARVPDVALLFAWNHSEEIMAKEQAFQAAGGRWLVYVPEVGLLP